MKVAKAASISRRLLRQQRKGTKATGATSCFVLG
jgi:hypothetical protein